MKKLKPIRVGEQTVFLLLAPGQDCRSENPAVASIGDWHENIGRIVRGVAPGTTAIHKISAAGEILATTSVRVR